jgi:hypothetical protein
LAYYNNIPGVLPTTESLVSVIIDGVVSSEFFEDRIVLQGLVASSQEITSVNNSGNIYIRTQGTGNLQTNRGFQLDNTGATPQSAVGIHHPSGDIKKISFENQPLISTTFGSCPPNSHWGVTDWDLGVTEGGSSGSPLYDQNHLIIGQLHGGASACGGEH